MLSPACSLTRVDGIIFFCKQKTADEMRMSDWSSDVCSSDLARSDTVMLVNIPANRERVVAVSFPRDLSIEPMQCEPWDPKTGQYGPITDPESPMYGADKVHTEYKLNSAYAVGGPKRSEARRVGEEGVSTCRSRGSPYH